MIVELLLYVLVLYTAVANQLPAGHFLKPIAIAMQFQHFLLELK